LPDHTVLFLVKYAVDHVDELIFGRLKDGKGGHCAMGAFWKENPGAVVNSRVIDEVAAVNDSVGPSRSPKARWKIVRSYLRWRLRVLSTGQQLPKPKILKGIRAV
jgi:hypothetical protein